MSDNPLTGHVLDATCGSEHLGAMPYEVYSFTIPLRSWSTETHLVGNNQRGLLMLLICDAIFDFHRVVLCISPSM